MAFGEPRPSPYWEDVSSCAYRGVCNCVTGPGPSGCSACGAPPDPWKMPTWPWPKPTTFFWPTTVTVTTTTNTTMKTKPRPEGEAMRAEDV